MLENQTAPQGPGPVGIDLGTTMCALAYVPAGATTAKLVPNQEGQMLTPSAVLITDDGVIAGQPALDSEQATPDNFSECFKRHVGNAYLPNKLRGRNVPPEVLCGFLLEKIRREASARIGPVSDAVITVPAFYGELHRTATQQAGRAAGLNVINIINEPTAAAIAYAYEKHQGNLTTLDRKRILVYDFGGGTFDATVLEYEGDQFRTLSTAGDVMLGGRDIDEQVFEHLADQFSEAYDIDPRLDPQWSQVCWRTAEKLKRELSKANVATGGVKVADRRLNVSITREEFESLIASTVEQTIFTTNRAIDDAKVKVADIDLILLVGGSSRIPLVSKRLAEETGKQPQLSEHPDEAVAMGAALFAATHNQNSGVSFTVANVNSHSLGIEGVKPGTKEPVYHILIPRNTQLPARKSQVFPTNRDNQQAVEVRIREGESSNPQHNTLIGRCKIPLAPNSPKGTKVEVTFQYGAEGTITIGACLLSGRKSARLEVRREGRNNIDPLQVWAARLVTGEDLTLEPHHRLVEPLPNNMVNHSSSTADVIKRIHFLGSQIGMLSLGEHLPPGVLAVQRQLKETVNELNFFQEVYTKAKYKYEGLEDRASRSQMNAVIRRAEREISRAGNLLLHLQIALGLGCARNNFLPAGAEQLRDELLQLQMRISNH